MVHDDDSVAESSNAGRPPSGTARVLLFAGVAGACLMGAGLGFWARPSEIERPGVKPVQTVTPTSTPRRIPIVVDDTPAPIGKPLDVMAPSPPRPAVAPPARPAPAPEIIAPSRPPEGLVRVAAPVPGPIEPSRPRTLLPPVAPQAAPARPAVDAAKLRATQLAAEQAEQRKLAQKAAQKAVQKAAQQQAKAERERLAEAKAEKLAKAKAKARKAREIELARAAPKPKPKHGISALLAKLAPHHEEAAAAGRKAGVRDARLTKAPGKARPKTEPAPPLMAPKGGGPIRIANKCASPDPGEALACGDPSLSAAERRLARAYRDAEAAGVPAATLAQQQQRWKAARAAAAREAPWAVREVYQARIAELQDMTRDAQGN